MSTVLVSDVKSNDASNFYRIGLVTRCKATHKHELIVREECHWTLSSRSCHVADDLPGVGGCVVHVNGSCSFII